MQICRREFWCLLVGIAGTSVLWAQAPTPTPAAPLVAPASIPGAVSESVTEPTLSQASPTPAPSVKKIAYGSCRVDGPYIAMTFDDGPNAKLTPMVLDALESRGIHATFFVVGSNAKLYPDLLKRMVKDGDEVGNHSWSHPDLAKLSVADSDQQILDTSTVIKAATGEDVKYLRPPYGAMSPILRHRIEEKFGMTLVYWSVDPLDWKYRNAQRVHDEILKQVKPGAIILSHDIHPTTVAAMPDVFDSLLAEGYKFVTVSELIAMNKPRASAKQPASGVSPSPTQQPKATL